MPISSFGIGFTLPSKQEIKEKYANFSVGSAGVCTGIVAGIPLLGSLSIICHELGHYTVGKLGGLDPRALVVFGKVILGSNSEGIKSAVQAAPWYMPGFVIQNLSTEFNPLIEKAMLAAGPIAGIAITLLIKNLIEKARQGEVDSNEKKPVHYTHIYKNYLLKTLSAVCSLAIFNEITSNIIPMPCDAIGFPRGDGNKFFETQLTLKQYGLSCIATALAMYYGPTIAQKIKNRIQEKQKSKTAVVQAQNDIST